MPVSNGINLTYRYLTFVFALAVIPLAILMQVAGSVIASALMTIFICASFWRIESKTNGGVDYFSPFAFVTVLMVLGFGIRPIALDLILGDFYRPGWGYNYPDFVELSLYALLLGQLGYISFWLGYQMKTATPYHVRMDSRVFAAINDKRIILLSMVFSFIGFSGYLIYFLMTGESSLISFIKNSVNIDKGGKYILFAISWMFVLGNLLYLHHIIRKYRSNILDWMGYTIHLLVGSVISVSFHDRKWLILFLLSILIYRHYCRKPVSVLTLAIGALVGIGLLLGMLLLRNALYVGGDTSVLIDQDVGRFIFEQLLVGGMFGYFDYFAYVVDTAKDLPSMLMYGIESFVLQFIPASLLGFEKPLVISQWLVESEWGEQNSARAPGITVFGEMFAFGKDIGVIFGMFLVGIYFRLVYGYLIGRRKVLEYVLIYILFFQTHFIVVRSMFLTSTVGFMLFVFAFLACLFIFRIVYSASVARSPLNARKFM